MGTSFRDVNHCVVIGSELDCDPASKARRIRSEVHDNIVNRPASAAHNSHLSMRGGLVVHASDRTPATIKRNVTLHDLRIESIFRKFRLAPTAREKPTFILLLLENDNPYASQ